jgi:alpha-beta hydrolase superfamily lysophospholipase
MGGSGLYQARRVSVEKPATLPPLDRIQFRGDKAAELAQPPERVISKPAWYMRPFVKLFAILYTRPHLLKRYISSDGHLLPKKHLKLYQPITPVGFQSLDGIPLQGYWLSAQGKSSDKTVVMGHGYTQDWREMVAIAEPLRKAGFNCFLFDFRTHGASEGETTTIGFHESKDIAAAVDTVTKRFGPQSSQVFYLGHSMGAAAMLMSPKSLEDHPQAMAVMEKTLDGIILDAPYYNFREIAERFLKRIGKMESDNWFARKVLGPWMQGPFGDQVVDGLQWMVKDYLKLPVDIFTMIPAQDMANSPLGQKPILVLHGDEDTVTPYDHGKRVYETLRMKNPGKTEFITIQGEEHLNRQWSPATNIPPKYWTAHRGDFSQHVLNVLDKWSAPKA